MLHIMVNTHFRKAKQPNRIWAELWYTHNIMALINLSAERWQLFHQIFSLLPLNRQQKHQQLQAIQQKKVQPLIILQQKLIHQHLLLQEKALKIQQI